MIFLSIMLLTVLIQLLHCTLYLLGVLFFFLGDLASLDRTIVMYNRSRGSSMLKKDLLYVYDMRVDMVVIVDAIARARRDKVNVVRNAALYAMKCVDALERTREGGGESSASGEGGGGSGALCREVREVPNEVVEEKEQNSSSSCSQAYESKYNESAVSSRQNTRRSDRSEQRHVSHQHHHQQERQQQLQQQQQQEEDEDEEDVFLEEEEEIRLANLISTLSSEDTKELNGALHQCMSGGGSVLMSTLLGGWLEEGAENLVSSFMMEIVDDGTTP